MNGSREAKVYRNVKRDPLSTRGGKVPTGSLEGLKPPEGGSTPPPPKSDGEAKPASG